MARRSKFDASVFDFVLVACRGDKSAGDVARLRVDGRTVVLEQRIVWKTASLVFEAVLTSVGIRADELVMPVRAGGELPAGVGGENFLAVSLEEIRRALQRGAGNAGVAGVVAKRKVELVGVGKSVAEISRENAIHEVVVWALAVGLEISGGSGIIEFFEEAAEVAATTGCG